MEKTIHKPYPKEPERPRKGLHRLFGGWKTRPSKQKPKS